MPVKFHTEDSKKKISDALKGIPRPDSVKQAISKKNKTSVRGMKMVKDGEIKKVSYDEIVNHIEDGWFFKSKMIWMNNGEKHCTKTASKWEEWLDRGWSWGSLTELNQSPCYHCGQRGCTENHY
jgi:hypothetical protein